ncbi:Purple acid phosphatase 3 [Dichanthelium oligosanthes]|uniref:Purple acid phosphatase n=1 Tax=Dichanthelium oligosanthes TaxID=888268 RepID=A0A1E5WB82_9POAL|nr:Purple acid phosphatase 3 [Dichanthelium oligosanthes]
MAPAALLVLLAVVAAVPAATAEMPRLEHPPNKADGSLTLLAVGDWGRRGTYNQSLVATQMGIVGEKMDIDFVISVGDNFYKNGLTGVDDKAFEESFTDIYTAHSLQKPWYTILGNHDYRGDALAQLSPILRKLDSRWICMKSFVVNSEIADFFFVDTTPFVLKYWNNPKKSKYDWRGVAPRENYIANVVKDVDAALKQSTAPWKIVVGHHAIRSVSEHGDTQELLQLLLPTLKAHGVDLYLNGHDHCLEHISSRDSPIQYLTSGAGSKAWRGIFTPNSDKLEFFHDGQGFMSLRLTKAEAHVAFYDVAGAVIHTWGLTKGAH